VAPTRTKVAFAFAVALVLCLCLPALAVAAATPTVDIVKVHGIVDPALAGYVRGTIQDAERDGSTVILQLDSLGSYGDQAAVLARTIRSAPIPVVVWVGPSGARVAGGALFLLYAGSLAAMAPGAGVGPGIPFDLGEASETPDNVAERTAQLVALAPGAQATADGARAASAGPALPAGTALAQGAVAMVAVDIPDLLEKLDGQTVRAGGREVVLATANRTDRPVDIRFHEIGPLRGVLHAISTPTAVYVLLLLGLWAFAFELTQPGFGVAGIAAALALSLAVYGLSVAPVHGVGIALLVAGTALMGLDVVIRRVQWLTLGGATLFAAGSVFASRGLVPAVRVPLWLIIVATAGGVLFFGFAMTVALRSRERIHTAQVGLVGLVGEARSDLNPEGGVLVKGSLWRARTMDGTIRKGSRIRVRAVEGLILRVEPESD
jgi:membrane-bound serine protease (ClpP class)